MKAIQKNKKKWDSFKLFLYILPFLILVLIFSYYPLYGWIYAFFNIPLASDSTDIALIRSQCGTLVKDTSWQMVFAKDEAEFNSLWENMCTQLEGLGWSTLTEYDTEKYQAIVDARIAAAE